MGAKMERESYKSLAEKAAREVRELMPWDAAELREQHSDVIVLDVRERSEFEAAHIPGSLNVPRGILEAACEYDYAETVPELVEARERAIVVVCRSGNRSAMAALVMHLIGYRNVSSMRLGMKGWNDADLPLVDCRGVAVDADDVAHLIEPRLAREQIDPARRR
ncbi:MAG: rhodanese-like domain-containing protein [Hyphomicrobiaceae bacterium]